MSLSDSPTRDELHAAYFANLGYDLENDVTKAREFIKACRGLLSFRNSVKRMSHGLSRGGGGEEVELDQGVLERRLEKAEAWLAANDTTTLAPSPGGGGVVHPDFCGFRK